MSADQTDLSPETLAHIQHARSLPDLPWGRPFTPYANIGQLLTERAAATPDQPFLIFPNVSDAFGDGSEWKEEQTYRQFAGAVAFFASLLTETLKLQLGDRIATLMVNDPATVLIYFSAWSVGITIVPINCGEDDDRIAYILQNSQAKVLFSMGDQMPRVLAIRDRLPDVQAFVQANGETLPGCLDLTLAIYNSGSVMPCTTISSDTEALIVYTSGTTGAPKGVVLDHANLLADAQSIAEWHNFGADDRAMCVLPIHHVNGITVTLMTPLYSGGSIVLNRRFSAQAFWKTLAAEQCTWVSVVPTVLAFLTERGEDLSGCDLSRFRHFICGAGPLTVETARRFDDMFHKRVVHGYGLSETTCYSCFLPIDLDADAYRHWMFDCGFPSIGCPISANEMAIHDAEGNALPPDTRGEIVIRGHNVMRGYFQRPDANRDTFAHGWFRSGDEGFYRRGADGLDYYFITGRLKELIIRGGVNYSPFDIDEVLNAIPGVKAAMAVGFENNFYGEEIGAYVQREEGATVTAEDILSACRTHLPFAKSPKVVVFGDTFPVTSTGKYQRNKLKPLFEAWKDIQFREARH